MVEKQKILHIVEAMGGGVFTYIVELANGLSDEFDITIAFGIRNETPENYAEYFNDNVKLIKVKNFGRSLNPIKDVKACFELRKIVSEVQPDIVHMHSSIAGAIGRLCLSDHKYKMFYTPHGYSFFMEDIPAYKRVVYKQLEKMFGKKNCLTIACGKGEWEKSTLVTNNSTYVSNGINTEKVDAILESVGTADSEHKFTVYTAGRISYQKHPELFNDIAKLMPDVKFMWIGDGDMREYLTSPNIEITGWAEGDETIKLAMQGDVFILPSRWEGLPIALLEAMYMKKLCIVSNVVGNRDIIANGESGYICDTAEEFAERIRESMESVHAEITENAYNEVVTRYNSNRLCRRYKELYLK